MVDLPVAALDGFGIGELLHLADQQVFIFRAAEDADVALKEQALLTRRRESCARTLAFGAKKGGTLTPIGPQVLNRARTVRSLPLQSIEPLIARARGPNALCQRIEIYDGQ